MAVDPEVEEGVNAVEVDVDDTAIPIGWHGECASVGAYFVGVLVDGPLRITGLAHNASAPVVHSNLMFEDDLLIDVDGHAIFERAILLYALYVPAARHLDIVPRSDVVGRGFKTLGPLLGRAAPMEFPRAIEALPVGSSFGQYATGGLLSREMESPGTGLLFVERECFGRLPLFTRWGSGLLIVGKALEDCGG